MYSFVFDIESSGLSTRYHSIIQLSGLLVNDDLEIVDTFDEYCRPHTFKTWSDEAEAVHKITKDRAKDFQCGHELLCKLDKFLVRQSSVNAVIHAAHRKNFYTLFDYSMLINLCLLHNLFHRIIYGRLPFCQSTILSKADFSYHDGPGDQKLSSWAEYLNIEFEHHNALADASVTLDVMRHQKEQWGRQFGRVANG